MTRFIDITGQRFGRLVAVRRLDERVIRRGFFWLFLCDCGTYLTREGSATRWRAAHGHVQMCRDCWDLDRRRRTHKWRGRLMAKVFRESGTLYAFNPSELDRWHDDRCAIDTDFVERHTPGFIDGFASATGMQDGALRRVA